MLADNLLEKAKAGDRKAFIDWFQPYQEMIARLAYQSGIPKDEIGSFKLQVIKEISRSLETVDVINAENRVMENAVRVLKKELPDSIKNQNDASIKFEEDQETHRAIQKLRVSERLAFLLVHFHSKNPEDAGEILQEPAAVVETLIEDAIENIREYLDILSEGDVQKRLDLLAKSYSRIQFPDEESGLVEAMDAVDEPDEEMETGDKAPVNRRTFAILAGASLFLSAVVGASFLFNDQPADKQQTAAEEENPTTVTTQMVKNWQAEYEEIRRSAPERLGLPAETFEQLEYVRKADVLEERTFSRQNVKQLQDDPERMQEQVDILMLSIETPKGMLDSVENYSLMASETSKFLWIYTEKTDQLMTITDGLLNKYKEELSDAEVNGELSAEKLTYSRGDYPEEIEKLTKALSEYTFQYTVHPNEKRFRTIRDVNKFFEIHPFNADMLSTYYLDVLRNAPFFDETGLLFPVEQLPYSLSTMAEFLSEPTVDPGLKGKVEPIFSHTFYSIVKGDGHTEVFDSNGVVKEEFQLAWKNMLQLNSNPVTFLMLPIFEEFEASGWKESVHFDQFAFQKILYAVDLASKGELVEKLPNGDLKVESVSQDMKDYDYSDIKPLYDAFSSSHDRNMLSGVEPMEIIKLYHYSNNIEDIETMWHLTADDSFKPPLEEYIERWKKHPEITETMRRIDIYDGNMHRQGREVFLIAIGTLMEDNYNFHNMHEMILITERDQIWLMQHQTNEVYAREDNFEEFDANVRAHYQSLVQSGNLETVQYASPGEIGGVFLLAMEKDDLKTVRLLVNVADNSIDYEEFKLRWMSMQMPAFSKIGGIFFRADTYNVDIDGISLRGDINIMNDATMMESSHYLQMEKVGESWMIGDMFNY